MAGITPEPILVSSCLLGLPTRYDGRSKTKTVVLDYLRDNNLLPIPVCPEQLAGLSTPRPATCFTCGDGAAVLDGRGEVCNSLQQRMNEQFIAGAERTLQLARLCGCTKALLKERSPSCGVHQVYLEEQIIPGLGVTAACLRRQGITLLSEEDLSFP